DACTALPAFVGLVLRHARGDHAHDVERADEVQVDDAAEGIEIVRRPVTPERAGRDAAARAVHARGQATESGRDLNCMRDVVARGHAPLHVHASLGRRGLGPIREHDPRARRPQTGGARGAEPRRGSGYECDSAGDLHNSSTSSGSPAHTTYSTLRTWDTRPT